MTIKTAREGGFYYGNKVFLINNLLGIYQGLIGYVWSSFTKLDLFLIYYMMDYMKHILQFSIIKEDEGGYSAAALDYGIVTQGETFEELLYNIREATELYFEDEEEFKSLHPDKMPFLLNLELPPINA